jgi:hypothetical protein
MRRLDTLVPGNRQQLGFAYAPIPEGVSLPIDDILRRIESLEARKAVEKGPEIAAVLGGERPPAIMPRLARIPSPRGTLDRCLLIPRR